MWRRQRLLYIHVHSFTCVTQSCSEEAKYLCLDPGGCAWTQWSTLRNTWTSRAANKSSRREIDTVCCVVRSPRCKPRVMLKMLSNRQKRRWDFITYRPPCRRTVLLHEQHTAKQYGGIAHRKHNCFLLFSTNTYIVVAAIYWQFILLQPWQVSETVENEFISNAFSFQMRNTKFLPPSIAHKGAIFVCGAIELIS